MSVRRRAVKERVKRTRALKDGLDKMRLELRLYQRVIEDAQMDGLTTLSPAEFAQRLTRTRRMERV